MYFFFSPRKTKLSIHIKVPTMRTYKYTLDNFFNLYNIFYFPIIKSIILGLVISKHVAGKSVALTYYT